LKALDFTCTEILPSPKTEHYRNRMDFVIDFEGRVGMRQKGKWWKVIDGHHCFLADTQIENLFVAIKAWTADSGLTFFDRKAHQGLLRYAVVRSSTLGQTMINIVTSAPTDEIEEQATRAALVALSNNCNATTIIWSVNSTITDVSFGDKMETMSGPGFIEESIGGFTFRITPNAFFQTNPHAAALLQSTVTEFAGDLTNQTLLDLYCGSGFFGVSLAAKTNRTIGVELVPEAIADAKINATLNGVTAEWHDAKTESFNWKDLGADTVILDPPRSGMHDKALADVISAAPATIVYVSCNYKNFAREMVQLQDYYKVSAMRAVDMFPHTPHVELVTKLERK